MSSGGYDTRGDASSNSAYYAGNAPGPAVGMAGASGAGGYGASNYDSSHVSYGTEKEKDKDKKKSSNTGAMLAAGVGGLAIGAVGTAVIAHEISTPPSTHRL